MTPGEDVDGFLGTGIREHDAFLADEMEGLALPQNGRLCSLADVKISMDGEKNLLMPFPRRNLAARFPGLQFAINQITGVGLEVSQAEDVLAPEVDGSFSQRMRLSHDIILSLDYSR